MQRKIVITGANAGIGFQVAKELLLNDDFVILFCRTKAKCIAAKKQLIEETQKENIDFFDADFSSFNSVRKAGESFQKKYDSLDVLINNAGGTFSNFELTEDGNEKTIQVNHLSPFLLTSYLLPALKKASNARIINTASIAHLKGSFDETLINTKEYFQILKNYGDSKLANILFTYKLAETLKDDNITVNCLHPGVVKTKIGDKSGHWLHKYGWQLLLLFKGVTIQKGAETTVFLAKSKTLNIKTGMYFVNKKETTSKELSYDKKLQENLWSWSEKLTKTYY